MNGPANVARHLSLLALAFLITGALSVLGGAALAVAGLAGGAVLARDGHIGGGAGTSGLFLVAGLIVAAGGVPQLLAWYGLSKRAPWGRWLAIALCTAGLAAFPAGTAFGAWGLWALLSPAALTAFRIERS